MSAEKVITCSKYLKDEGFEELNEVVTLITGKKRDLSFKRKLQRWYHNNRIQFDGMVLLAKKKKKEHGGKNGN